MFVRPFQGLLRRQRSCRIKHTELSAPIKPPCRLNTFTTMIVYPVAELVGYFANSRETVGFVDPETLTVIYGNRAFELSIEDFQLKSGKNPLQDFSSVQSAMEQCCRELKAISCELPQWDSLIELLPVQLQHVDGSLQLALLYKLFSLEFSRSPGFAEDALSSLPYTTWACSMNGEIFWTNRASKKYA